MTIKNASIRTFLPPSLTPLAASVLDDFDRIAWDINEAHERALDNIIDSLTADINANDFVVKPSPSMHVPATNLADTDDDEPAPDPDEDDRDIRSVTTSQAWLELEKHARNQVDTGRCRLRSGTVHARSSQYHPDKHALIKKKSHVDMQKNSCQHKSHHVNMQVISCQHAFFSEHACLEKNAC